MQAERLDGSVLLAGCDKSPPGMLMAAARLDLASVFLYAGSILPGRAKLSGRHREGRHDHRRLRSGRRVRPRTDEPRGRRRHRARDLSGEGACGGTYTANTMASAAEALGMSLPGSAAPRPPIAAATGSPARAASPWSNCCRGITARDILTKEAFENAIAVVMAFGGSTNAVLHLLAIAYEANVKLARWRISPGSAPRCHTWPT